MSADRCLTVKKFRDDCAYGLLPIINGPGTMGIDQNQSFLQVTHLLYDVDIALLKEAYVGTILIVIGLKTLYLLMDHANHGID